MQDWLRRNAQRSPRLYGFLRSVKRTLAGSPAVSPAAGGPALPADARRGRIEIESPTPPFNVGASARVAARVTNTSAREWPAGAVGVSYHWRRSDGSVWAHDGGRTPCGPLDPGATVTLECVVKSPNTPAAYALELELVSGGEHWFGAAGSTRRDVTVGGMQPDAQPEIDYEQIYKSADLAKDYWAVSGPASADEFQRLGQAKLKMLQELGLRPESRVLDVGCGTGSLTEAMAGFLSSDGLYYGTDLSEVAVQFCREKFPRANFFFAKNGMTTVPIEDMRFDFVVFFSVFTHTYPAETQALLAEAARVLGERGQIVADVFESDIEGESLGTRAMTVLPRGKMLEIAAAEGLEARTLTEFSWDPTGPRRIDRVMRRFSRAAAAVSASRT
jgi:ubiquinone/menaquinone biosynthesis C-methylase UbiE